MFLPALLENVAVALFAALRGNRIVAGCAGNRSGNAVGFSNFFAEAIDVVSRFAPGPPIVGYEHGEALGQVRRLGSRAAAGPLRVWTTESP